MAPGRILYVSRWFPDPPDDGARRRARGQLPAPSQDHDVTLVSFAEAGPASHPGAAVKQRCAPVITVPHPLFRPQGWRARAGLGARL